MTTASTMTSTMDQRVTEWWASKTLADQLREKERTERIQALLNEPYVFPTSKSSRNKLTSPNEYDVAHLVLMDTLPQPVSRPKRVMVQKYTKDDSCCVRSTSGRISDERSIILPSDNTKQNWLKGLNLYKKKSKFASDVYRVYGDCDYSQQLIHQRYVEINGVPNLL